MGFNDDSESISDIEYKFITAVVSLTHSCNRGTGYDNILLFNSVTVVKIVPNEI